MKNLYRLSFPMFVLMLATCISAVPARAFKASLAQMPVYAESDTKGILVDFVKAISKVSGEPVEIHVVPFKRSIYNVTSGQADCHIPLIANPNADIATLPYDYAKETIFHVNFILYTHKDKPLDINKIDQHIIETDAAHTPYFHDNIIPSSSTESSLKKVNIGRIDGFIFADDVSDPFIRELKLTNIKRQLYKRFDVKIVIPKGSSGKSFDQFLSDSINKLRANGQFDAIMKETDHPYDDWQP